MPYDKLATLANQEIVNKYSYNEQKYGLELLVKIEEGTLTKEDKLDITTDYRKKEIFDTVANEETRDLFLYEIKNNGLMKIEALSHYENRYQYSESLFRNLAKNINVFEDLMYAQRDNLMRENEEQKHRRKAKKRNRKKQSKQKHQTRGL